jgi:hypothetical protein
MSEKRFALITFHERKILARFVIQPPDRSIGIMGPWVDDITLHDPISEQRLEEFEENLSDSDWETVAFLVEETIEL